MFHEYQIGDKVVFRKVAFLCAANIWYFANAVMYKRKLTLEPKL